MDARTGLSTRNAETIVDAGGITAAFDVQANNVIIDGFTVKAGAGTLGTGVYYTATDTGWQLLNSIITDNQIGVYAQCGGSCLLSKNRFDGNNRAGPAGGAGIYTEITTGLTIDQNEFKNHTINSSVIFASVTAPSHHNVTFTSNNIHDNPPGDSAVYAVGMDTGTFSSNKVAQPNGTSLSLASGNNMITVQNNDFSGSKRGLRVADDGYGFSNNTNLTVSLNSFASDTEFGASAPSGFTRLLDASKNCWGSATGPTNVVNPGGTGSTVVGTNIRFAPWLADCADTSAAIGFQPNSTLASFAINVSPTSGLTTTEDGGIATFSIVLAAGPTDTVKIGLSSSNTSEGNVSTESVTFTPANWNVPQTVTVAGVASGPPNGNVAYTIVTAPAVSNDPAYSGTNPADVSVTNNAGTSPTISIADVSQPEGTSGLGNMTFTVSLSRPSSGPVSVSYATVDGSAKAPSDYSTTSGSLSFSPGETSKTFNVLVVGDSTVEPDETFTVQLSNPSGGTIARATATGTIQADELAPSAVCAPRPKIDVQTATVGGRRIQVTVRVGTEGPNVDNTVKTIEFGTPTNATLQMTGQTSIGTSPISLPAGTRQLVFIVQQTNPSAAVQVPFTVTDACGSWPTFVGGGANAFAP
jgi:hypothetical protein